LSDPTWWLALTGAVVALLVLDLIVMRGRGGVMSLRFAALASAFWVAVAVAFGGLLLLTGHPHEAGLYFTGYLVEKSLSLDNVFVFLLVLNAFAVPPAERHRLLTYGIAGALVLRLVMIVAGAAALEEWGWLAFPFAALLVWTGWRMWRERDRHGAEAEMVAGIAARLPISDAPPEGRLWRREAGRLVLTSSGAALAAIAIVDVVFAVDSVPAILAITTDTFIVFAANAFALLGLRPLFFLVADLVARLHHLKAALAALLVFIGAKMALGEVVGKIGPEISLPVIALILGTGVVASLVRERRAAPAEPPVHA
jgi:tellurite resistance protein TerC